MIRSVFIGTILLLSGVVNSPADAQYKIEGWPIRRSWGPLKSAYVDARTRELRMVFEDATGAIRIVTVDAEAHTAVPVAEFKRE